MSNVLRTFAYQFINKTKSNMEVKRFSSIPLKNGSNHYPFVRAFDHKQFFAFDEKPLPPCSEDIPNYIKVENLTNPNRESSDTVLWKRTMVKASIGDVLTIEMEEGRFVIFSYDWTNCYLLFSGDNQMVWPTNEQIQQRLTEVVEALRRNFVEYVLREIISSIGIDPFSNFDQIVDFIVEDVKTAGMDDFSDENIRIAFRRFVERQM